MPKTGPPIEWIRRNGKTPGCYACDNPSGKSHGRVHSRQGEDRYLDWLRKVQEGERKEPANVPQHPRMDLEMPPTPEPPFIPPDVDDSDQLEYEPSIAPSDMFQSPWMLIVTATLTNQQWTLVRSWIQVFSFEESVESEEELTAAEWILQTACPLNLALSFYNCKDTEQDQKFLSPLYLPKAGNPTEYTEFKLSGKKAFLASPTNVISEDSGRILDIKKTESGRLVELESLNHVRFGSVITKSEAEKYAKLHGIKILGTRWIVNPKEIENEEGVRCRLVVQEIASGSSSAASQGISSSTPSGESLRIMLTLAATEGYDLTSLDISTAFVHSPLPKGNKAVVRLPGDVSWKSTIHEPVYAILHNSLNGLRVASLAWLELARRTHFGQSDFVHHQQRR